MDVRNRLRAAAGPACVLALTWVAASGAASTRSEIGSPVMDAGGSAVPEASKKDPAKKEKRRHGEPEAQAPSCPNADARPVDIGIEAAEAALLCAINSARSARGVPTLSVDPRLRSAAAGHSADMVRRRYFAHDTKRGQRWSERVRAGGYAAGARFWRIGETLAWAGGRYATATMRVQAWLDSKPHRKVMLEEDFREVGLGIVYGTPEGVPGTTFTADYGRVQ